MFALGMGRHQRHDVKKHCQKSSISRFSSLRYGAWEKYIGNYQQYLAEIESEPIIKVAPEYKGFWKEGDVVREDEFEIIEKLFNTLDDSYTKLFAIPKPKEDEGELLDELILSLKGLSTHGSKRNFEVFFHMEGSYWIEVMLTFLNSKGYELCSDDMFKRFHPNDTTVLPHGFSFRGLSDVPKGDKREFIPAYYDYKDKYYLVSGKSARDVNHTCIYQTGNLVHDPHPSKEGLLTLDYFETLEKIQTP